jgi:hypothetical protein
MIVSTHGIVASYVGVSYDTDAQAFITAANITDNTQKNAINQLVLDLKSYSIWTKFKAIYPFIGGTASSHKYNLKDPRDLDAAFRLQFVNGWTHSSTGALPNGTDAYADTKLSALNVSTTNHLSYYSRTTSVGVTCELGCYDSTTSTINQLRPAANYAAGNVALILSFTSTTDAKGFWVGSKRGISDREIYKNSTSEATSSTLEPTNNPNKSLYLGARNENAGANNFSNKECAFASIGDGFSDAEEANLYTAVNAFQVALSRNV